MWISWKRTITCCLHLSLFYVYWTGASYYTYEKEKENFITWSSEEISKNIWNYIVHGSQSFKAFYVHVFVILKCFIHVITQSLQRIFTNKESHANKATHVRKELQSTQISPETKTATAIFLNRGERRWKEVEVIQQCEEIN